MKAAKCAFMEKELECLSHFILGECVKVDQKKKLRPWLIDQLPKDVSVLRRFLGLTINYRWFVKGYGLIAKPLTAILKKDKS